MRHGEGQIGFIVLEEPACTVPFTTRAGGVWWPLIKRHRVITPPFGAWWGSVGWVLGSAHHGGRLPYSID